jgi:hypothetical protein
MRCWRRLTDPVNLEFDDAVDVDSLDQWRQLIADPGLISSILWPEESRFSLDGPDYRRLSHPHEKNYRNDPSRNASYRSACGQLARRLQTEYAGANILVYAPLRGALPIWKGLRRFAPELRLTPYFPVTSSFVFYPEEYGIRNRKGRPASGRFTNILELRRLHPFLEQFDILLYVDEIVSGGMMKGHLRDMLALNIDREIPLVAVGLADRFGDRAVPSRRIIEGMVQAGRVRQFLWEGCAELITEDQRFLLGIHYTDYQRGPHVVPMLTEDLTFYPDHVVFEEEAFGGVREG